MNWYMAVLKQYAVFSGRARRTEFWMFYLFHVIVSIVLVIITAITLGIGLVLLIPYSLATLIPFLAVAVRRLHDTGKSGWWLLLYFVPFGGIVLLIFWFTDSTPGDNSFGPNPKAVAAPAS